MGAQKVRVHGVGIALLAALVAAPGVPAAHGYDFRVDRFAVDGNVFGPSGGPPDRVDEFDDGSLFPEWNVYQGTASQMGGFLHLTSPGTRAEDPFGILPRADLEISTVYGTSPVVDGAGDFTATSAWPTTALARGDFNHFSLFGYRSPIDPFSAFEVVGLAITNRTPELEGLAAAPDEVREAAEAAGWLEGGAQTAELAELMRIRPREREAAVRRSLRAPPGLDEPPLLRAWRAWALSGRRMP